MQSKIKISASKLKTFQGCSWQYWCKYHLKLPDTPNLGAQMGTICHSVFELLQDEKHKDLYDAVMKNPATIENCEKVKTMVTEYIEENKLPSECFDKIDTMIIVGLSADFFCKGGKLLDPEFNFDLTSKEPNYHITGKIDKQAIYNDKYIRVVDYKSSKKKFEGDDLKVNIQAMMYSLAAKKLWPHLIPIVDFVFLQFPKDAIQRLKFSEAQLRGFEHFLGDVYKQMSSFDEEAAKSNFAAKQKFPEAGAGFKGPLMCGWAGKGFVKEKGQLKKNGEPMFHCPYRFDFSYYVLCNENGEALKSSFKDDLRPDKSKGEFVIKKQYKGCPAFEKKKVDTSFLS